MTVHPVNKIVESQWTNRTQTLLEDMRKVLAAQRECEELISTEKKKRYDLAHNANIKQSFALAQVANEYPTKETRAAAADVLLEEDNTYKEIKQAIAEIDETLFVAKLDLKYFEAEFTVLKVEANLMAVKE